MKNFHLHQLIIYILLCCTTFMMTEHQSLISNVEETEEIQPVITEDYQSSVDAYNQLVLETIEEDQFDELLLINAKNPINSDTHSMSLLPTTSAMFIRARGEEFISTACFNSLEQLFEDGQNLGYNDLIINSIYRDFEEQEVLYNNRLSTNLELYEYATAVKLTDQYVAKPGYSEHQLGLAMDISSTKLYKGYDQLEDIASFQWLYKNCYKYGLLLRYPKDKENITGIAYEPWHFRYVGKPVSEYIYNQNLCFEEYVSLLKNEEIISFTDENNKSYTMYYINHLDDYNFFDRGINVDRATNISKVDGSSYIITVLNNDTH